MDTQNDETALVTKNNKLRKRYTSLTIILTGSLLIALVVGIGISGYVLGYNHGSTLTSKQYESKIAASAPLLSPINPEEEVKQITGTITDISGTTITVDAAKITSNFLESGDRIVYTVRTNGNTAVEEKSTSLKPGSEESVPALEIISKEIALSDLAVGESVSFYADEDLRNIIEFTATKIERFKTPELSL